jgi:hypothetical protein
VCACNALSPSCISLPVSLQWSWRSHSSGFGIRSKFVTSGLCLKSSLLPASVCHLQCSLLMQFEKSQLLIQTLFQICRKQCVLALANKETTNKHKKREKSSKKRKQKCEKYATVIVGARNDSQKRAKTTRTTLHCRQTDCGRLCLWICTMTQMRSS